MFRFGVLGAAAINRDALVKPVNGRDDVELASVAARDRTRAVTHAAKHGIATVHDTYEAILDDPSIDAVYIPLPPTLHERWAIAAIEAGKHVLVEKPFADTARAARAIRTAADGAVDDQGRRLVVMEGFHWRHHPMAARMLDIVASGEVGELVDVSGAFRAPILGKDNIPFHTIIWPGILIAYNEWRAKHGKPLLNLPFDVPANEFLNLDGQQFSKSRGISIGVHDVLDRFQADAVRYYLSVNMPEQRDSDWTWDDFLSKVNDELVGTMGNLVHRVLSFTQKNLGQIPAAADNDLDAKVTAAIEAAGADMASHLNQVQLKKAVRRLLEFAGWGNQTMQETAPWKLLKDDRAAGEAALYSLLRVVKALAVYMAPYMPAAADQAWQMLGEKGSVHDASWDAAAAPLQSGHALELPKALFTKLDPKSIPGAEVEEKPKEQPKKAKKAKPAAEQKAPGDGTVDFDTFSKVQLKIAKIVTVDDHPKADKLYVLMLDVGGEERQVVAGLKAYYTPEELAGQTVAFVANLAPVKLRGVESQGMILAADHGDVVSVLNPNREMPAGAQIR